MLAWLGSHVLALALRGAFLVEEDCTGAGVPLGSGHLRTHRVLHLKERSRTPANSNFVRSTSLLIFLCLPSSLLLLFKNHQCAQSTSSQEQAPPRPPFVCLSAFTIH